MCGKERRVTYPHPESPHHSPNPFFTPIRFLKGKPRRLAVNLLSPPSPHIAGGRQRQPPPTRGPLLCVTSEKKSVFHLPAAFTSSSIHCAHVCTQDTFPGSPTKIFFFYRVCHRCSALSRTQRAPRGTPRGLGEKDETEKDKGRRTAASLSRRSRGWATRRGRTGR